MIWLGGLGSWHTVVRIVIVFAIVLGLKAVLLNLVVAMVAEARMDEIKGGNASPEVSAGTAIAGVRSTCGAEAFVGCSLDHGTLAAGETRRFGKIATDGIQRIAILAAAVITLAAPGSVTFAHTERVLRNWRQE